MTQPDDIVGLADPDALGPNDYLRAGIAFGAQAESDWFHRLSLLPPTERGLKQAEGQYRLGEFQTEVVLCPAFSQTVISDCGRVAGFGASTTG
jgi:hypothetical protein